MLYVILIAIALVLWLVVVDRPILRVDIKNGHIDKIKGHITPSFKHNLVEIGAHSAFDGVLKVYRTRTSMKLRFSKQVPKNIQQRIRNVFPYKEMSKHGTARKA